MSEEFKTLETPYGIFKYPVCEGDEVHLKDIVDYALSMMEKNGEQYRLNLEKETEKVKIETEKVKIETEKVKKETTHKIVTVIGNGIDVLNNIYESYKASHPDEMSEEEWNNLPDDLK